jgi:cell division protein FtsI (penicillin-binding protein 3)
LKANGRTDTAAALGGVRGINYSSSPLLASKTPPSRSRLVVALLGLAFCALIARALWVQFISADFYLKQGEIRYARTMELSANRGRIVDRNGQLLALSVPAPSVWAIPKEFDADPIQRRELARLLGVSVSDIEARLDGNVNFAWIKRQVDESIAQKVAALRIKGLHQVKEFKREYPEGESVAHLVGFTDIEDRGQEGVELAYQRDLSGRDGERRVIKDRLGRVVEDVGEAVAPVNGRDVALSLDSKIQFYAYQRLRDAVRENKAKAGSVVVLDAQSGEVLALANYPSFTPADRRRLEPAQLRNRALIDTFEPGSTMKPFVAALALETRRVKPDTVLQTGPKSVLINGWSPTDAHPHDALTVREVIQKSSNIGTVRMAMQMSPREMHSLYSSLGFGQRPPVSFPGLASGKLRHYKSWRPIEQATMSYGYGLSASLIQLARAYTVFAHDGELIPVTLTKSAKVPAGLRLISPSTALEVRRMLQLAASEGGTAPLAQTASYSVGGKSGTAHKQEGKGYAMKKYRSWFVGLAPIEQPRIVVAVMIDEPTAGQYFGGAVAGPVFSQVVQQTLRNMNVAPDLEAPPPVLMARSPRVDAVQESF